MTELEIKIKNAAQKYYSDGSSEYTDSEFDELVNQLRLENPTSELLKGTGFGYEVNKVSGQKCNHRYTEITGLDKIYKWEDAPKIFKSQIILYATPKLDGLSVVLYYKNGMLYQALTRGRNNIGIDITDKIKYIMPENLKSDKLFTGAVRGEIIMRDESFDKFIKTTNDDSSKIKNPRNCAAGLINSKEINENLKYLDVIVYTLIAYESIDLNVSHSMDYVDIMNWLKSNFYKHVNFTSIYTMDKNLHDELNKLKDSYSKIYPVDGVVLTHPKITTLSKDNYQLFEYNQIAYKFKSETAEVTVKNVEWNYSKSRYMIPKIQVETVELSGTNVTYCTGYNAKYILDNKIGKGAVVEIEKRGEIIPNVNKVVSPSQSDINLPEICPNCGESLVWDGVHLRCPNSQCKGAKTADLLCWLRTLAPVDGLGDVLRYKLILSVFKPSPFGKSNEIDLDIDKLMNHIYRLSSIVEYQKIDKRKLTGQAKLLHEMLDKLCYRKDISVVDALKSLNIPRLGDITCTKLSKLSSNLKLLLNAVTSGHIEGVEDIQNIMEHKLGNADAQSVFENIDKFKYLNYIYDRIQWETDSKSIKGSVAITGKLSVPRNVFKSELESAGFELGELKKSTMYLITDDPNSNSSKNIKADSWNIPKITESDFRNQFMK